MKHLFVLLILVPIITLSTSCSVQKDLDKKVYYYGYIFTEYSDKGFLFTPAHYSGEYRSIGILVVEIYPPIRNENYSSNNQYGVESHDYSPSWVYSSVQPKEVLDSLYNVSKMYGADAVIDLEITSVSAYRTGFINPIPGIKASGFAIKRIQE